MEVRSTPKQGGEKETLLAYLNNNRAIVEWKLSDLANDDARRPMVESGTNLIGLVKHLAWVERYWFEEVFSGTTVPYPAEFEDDPEADLRATAADTIASVVALYESHVDLVNEIIDEADVDDLSKGRRRGEGPAMNLRSIMLHMLEETARHAGHADIVREMIDGRTGYMPDGIVVSGRSD